MRAVKHRRIPEQVSVSEIPHIPERATTSRIQPASMGERARESQRTVDVVGAQRKTNKEASLGKRWDIGSGCSLGRKLGSDGETLAVSRDNEKR